MLKLYYKVYLFLFKKCRFIKVKRSIIISKSFVNGGYYFWYIDSKNKLRLLNIGCSYTKEDALFRYKVLMGR